MPVQIEWESLGRDQFNRVVEALLVRLYRDDAELSSEPLDGRGGDGGRDVDVRRRDDDTLVGIYQLKYFPGGFSGGNAKARKPQITKSFVSAMGHNPRWWTLIIPTNPTPKERAFVRSLAEKRRVKVSIMGRAQLDAAIAGFPDLLDAFTRDPLVQILRETGHERAGLVHSADLDSKLGDLARRIDGRSPYWGESVRLERGMTVRELYAKDPRAGELEPIRLTLDADAGELDDTTRARLTRVLDFGDGRVKLPSAAVRAFSIEGPEWIASREENVEVEIGAILADGATHRAVELRVLDADGCTEAAIRGRTDRVSHGRKGVTLGVEFPGGLRTTFRLPVKGHESGGLDASYELAGEDVLSAERAVFTCNLMRAGRPTEIWIDGARLGTVVGSFVEGSLSGLTEDPYLLLSDLAVVAKQFDLPLAYPRQVTVAERGDIRRLRLLLDGRCVLLPGVGGMKARLTGTNSPDLESFLLADVNTIAMTSGTTFEVQGHQIPLDGLRVFHPSLHVTGGAGLVELVRQGLGEGVAMEIKPSDGTPFRAVLVDRVFDPDAPLLPVPLGVPDLPEHPALARILGTPPGDPLEK